ncbi:RNA recognition motif containing protein, putative [Babesia bigemina]|uniref:RNA recognition motif containing protein, putative n=1 Tax=Babesia bigemina TaxID=5866 RepID=A0A061CZ69_BABBI|nr:RNA recognition motif containing protein, putative [Babesia bigemina]CDR93733.1 RNA recognition motif containing protein, putative [Babesia bigemina]|eukprot:XP_012765919.1 RNA recognition motif containing protein, putative [Babesia bigemina]
MDDDAATKSSVIYVGNLPKTLTESQIRMYFNQFGTVVNIRLMKSKKTGNSRGYCYVKFESHEIASITAEAMNNYFIDGRVLKVHVKETADHVRYLFKKGRPILNRRRRLLIRSRDIQESRDRAEATVSDTLNALGKKHVAAETEAEQLRSRLQSAIERMEAKQSRLGTNIHDSAIRKYKRALELLSTSK